MQFNDAIIIFCHIACTLFSLWDRAALGISEGYVGSSLYNYFYKLKMSASSESTCMDPSKLLPFNSHNLFVFRNHY